MDNTAQRKRSGRCGKLTIQQQQPIGTPSTSVDIPENILKSVELKTSSREDPKKSNIMETSSNIIDGSAISISPTSDSPIDSALAGTSPAASECRRSSRKKIIKFDVRDLLNKNRKPHKIQIEARIDSNAPTSSAMPAVSSSSLKISTSGPGAMSTAASVADLSSKQKTFIEKSAIFRRYSISEQQNKIHVPTPRPPLAPPTSKISLLSQNVHLTTSEDGINSIPVSTQIPMDPIKIAQARRLNRTQEIFNASMMKSKQNSSLIVAQMESSSIRPTVPITSGKRKVDTPSTNTQDKKTNLSTAKSSNRSTSRILKRRGRPRKSTVRKNAQELHRDSNTKSALLKGTELMAAQKTIATSGELYSEDLTPEKATNWKEYKECLKAKERSTQIDVVESNIDEQNDDEVLEISSSSDSELEELHTSSSASSSSVKDLNQSPKQRNFAAVSFIKETPLTVNDNKTDAPEFIVAAVEEILTDYPVASDSYESPLILAESKSGETTELISIPVELTVKNTTNITTSEAPTMERKLLSRTSSGSESEANSDRSNKSYKLRVSVKRLSPKELSPVKDNIQNAPPSPSTSICSTSSSTRNSLSENSATSSKDTGEMLIKQTKKRSKRLQMKSEQISVSSTSTASEVDNEEKLTKVNDNSLPVNVRRTKSQFKGKPISKQVKIVNKSPPEIIGKTLSAEREENKPDNTEEKQIVKSIDSTPGIEKVDQETQHVDLNNDNAKGKNQKHQSMQSLKDNNVTSLNVIAEESVKSIDDKINKSLTNLISEEPNIQLLFLELDENSVKGKIGKTSKRLTKPTTAEEENNSLDQSNDNAETVQKIAGATKCEAESDKQNTDFSSNCSRKKENRKSPPKTQLQKQKTIGDIKAGTGILSQVKEKKKATPLDEQELQFIETVTNDKTIKKRTAKEQATTTKDEKATTSKQTDTKTIVVVECDQISPLTNEKISKTPIEQTLKNIESEEEKTKTSKQGDKLLDDIKDNSKILHSLTAEKEALTPKVQENSVIQKLSLDNKMQIVKTEKKLSNIAKQQDIKFIEDVKNNHELATPLIEENSASATKKRNIKVIDNEFVGNSMQKASIAEPKVLTEEKTIEAAKNIIYGDNVSTEIILDMPNDEAQDSVSKLESITRITEGVSVETKTLLDILKTVQTNEIAAATVSYVELDEKSLNTTGTKATASKKRNSPTRSDTSSPQEVKKHTRRYERRSKRGEESTHMTLEETFAEIAAQSSKEILEMAAALETQHEETEEKEQENETVKDKTEAIRCDSITVEDKLSAECTDILSEHTDEKSENIDDTNIQELEVLNVKIIEYTEAESEKLLELAPKPSIILQNTTEENGAETKLEVAESNKEIANKSYAYQQVNVNEDTKTEKHFTITKCGRKSPTRHTDIITAVETVNVESEIQFQKIDIIEKVQKEVKTVKSESFEKSNTTSVVQNLKTKDQTKSQLQQTFERVGENSEAFNVITKENESKTIKYTKECTEQLNIPTEFEANSENIKSKENIKTLEIKNSTVFSQTVEDRLIEKEELKNIEPAVEKDEVSKLKPSATSAEQLRSTKSIEASEAKALTEKDKTVNTQNIYMAKKSEKEKTSQPTAIKASLNLEANEKNEFKLEKSSGDDKCLKTIYTDEVRETSEKVKVMKKSRKSENIFKTKMDTKLKLESNRKSPKLKKPSKNLKNEELKGDECTGNTSDILDRKDGDCLNSELKGDTASKQSREILETAEKTSLTPKITEDVKDVIIEKAKSADKIESTSKSQSKKRLYKTKSDTELLKDDIVQSLDTSVDTDEAKEKKEKNKKAKRTLKFKDIDTKTKTNTPQNVMKHEEDTVILVSQKTPPKRGSKLKQKTVETEIHTSAMSSSKRKTAKTKDDILKEDKSSPMPSEKHKEKSLTKKSEKKKFLENETNADIERKSMELKTAKKKRQKKLKEAFEAALKEETDLVTTKKEESVVIGVSSESPHHGINSNTGVDINRSENQTTPPHYNLPLTPTNFDLKSPKPSEPEVHSQPHEAIKTTISQPEEEDPDPLKDIEKFIEDGVNLLKRGYKIEDDDSVDDVLCASKTTKADLTEEFFQPLNDGTDGKMNYPQMESNDLPPVLSEITSFADTPADTPLATPTTSPSKSPVQETNIEDSFSSGVRRSHRIKLNKTPKALVGRGLVRDKERFSNKDDVETKSHYTIDDHRMDLAEVEAKNAKFLKDMEERLSNFILIKENEYKCERIVSREARKMICDCFLTAEEEGRGELACGEDCLNRLLMIECGPDCNVKERCTNKRFQKFLCSPCRVFRTEKKGFGILADIEILPGEFIMEYVGEVINGEEFENRRIMYSQDKNRHYYFMALRSDAIIDATSKGNISRFINHSCDPNAETQKWTVNGELRIGFFSRKSIMPGEEITFDYQYQRYGREAQRCYCESSNCRGWIGEEPNSDEGEQVDDESDEENLAESLLDDDDEDDSDETEDAEEAQKKLEIAAAEAKLMPISDEDKKGVEQKSLIGEERKREPISDNNITLDVQKENEEDSKSKFKKLLSKMAEKVAKKREQKERKQRKQRTTNADNTKHVKPRYLEDPDIEDEVHFLSRCGLKNQSDTLRLSRLMVRAKLVQTRLNLLKILRSGDLPCRRLFLDYHGLRLLHGWMSEDGGDLQIRMALLETLETLPIANKTMLTDSKVYQTVHNWCGGIVSSSTDSSLSPSDESSKESSSSITTNIQPTMQQEVPGDLQKLATKLTATWDSLPEIFRIPKKERIEQMKEHEREADRQYAAIASQEEESRRNTEFSDRYQRNRFGRGPPGSNYANRFAWTRGGAGGVKDQRNITTLNTTSGNDPRRRSGNESLTHTASDNTKHLSKEQRREMFAAKVARDEAEKRLAEERREFETKCRFFGLDPKKTRPKNLPFCVNPATGQWYSVERQPIPTPPTYAHVQVPVKPKSTNPTDYQLPACALNLTHQWKFAITPQGKIYYYHVQFRVPQWEPPTIEQLYGELGLGGTNANASDSGTDADVNDSTDDDDEIIKGMDATKLQTYIEKKIEMRRQQRYGRLVDERPISPRREEDRIYNQLEVRKYKENKEKIRKRKEEIRRKRVEAVKNSTLNMCTLGSLDDPNSSDVLNKVHGGKSESGISNALPIQDYLLSSDEEEMMKAECNNSPLLDKIVQGDKIVDELDALTTKRALKRPLPPHRDLSGFLSSSSASTSSGISVGSGDKHEHKKRKLEKRESSKGKKSRDHDSKYRKLKEKFRCEIAGIIVHHLKPYRKDSCVLGRIKTNEDFNHLARKLTHFVMIKELKYCESVGQTLVVTESVKNKSREFIKKYMAKYGDEYIKPRNDPDFKDIPFNL